MNNFKIGDKVRVYYVSNFKALVTDGVVCYSSGDVLLIDNVGLEVHYRQCELLEEELHPQDRRGYSDNTHYFRHYPIQTPAKFKVDDFVWYKTHGLHQITNVFLSRCPMTQKDEWKYTLSNGRDYVQEGDLQKLNINREGL